uniref:Uncharacterized protein n=1 Tax=Molossus molossus TaxID=27622 RepID=A0A7J8CPZ1_MOLMO|nr:hypothetical protein HJG59_001768 [Molossus molossus]
MNLPNLFPVPDDLSKAWRHQSDPVLGRSRPLCPTCREMKMVQPRTMMIPDDLKRSFEHLTSHRMKSLQPPKAQTVPECSRDDLLTDCFLPVSLGPQLPFTSSLCPLVGPHVPLSTPHSFLGPLHTRVDAALSVLAWRTGERALQTAHPGPQDGRLLPAAVGRLAHPAGGTGPFLARPAANRQDSQAASDQSICPRLSEGKQP